MWIALGTSRRGLRAPPAATPPRSESTLDDYTRNREGKLWTTQQIEDNLRQGLFSEYFEQEYPYLRQTALQAEQYLAAAAVNLTSPAEATELSPAPEGAAVHGV